MPRPKLTVHAQKMEIDGYIAALDLDAETRAGLAALTPREQLDTLRVMFGVFALIDADEPRPKAN